MNLIRPASLPVLALAPLLPLAANAAVVTANVDPAENAAVVLVIETPQPGPIRQYESNLSSGGNPVVLPFNGSAFVASDATPDDADDTAAHTVEIDHDGFSVDVSTAGAASAASAENISSASAYNFEFSVDVPVVYTISGSGTASGAGLIQVGGDLIRVSDSAELYSDVATGTVAAALGTGSGLQIGTLVAGETYLFSGLGAGVGSPPIPFSFSTTASIALDLVDAADADLDGVADDGDVSGSSIDAPCTGGDNLLCDDNCPSVPNLDQADSNSNGVGDACEAPSVPALASGGIVATTFGLLVTGAYAIRRRITA